jgi:hypothetical protein
MSLRALYGCLACIVLAGCSALGLDEYDQIQCSPDDSDGSPECDALNAGLPAGSCARFYCSPTGLGCVFEERTSEEKCDGLDNDCDLAIDEEAPAPDDERRMMRPLDGVVHMSPAVTEDRTLHVVLTHEGNDDLVLSHFVDSVDDPHEVPLTGCQSGAGAENESCKIADLALAATSTTLVGAGFHRSTCNGGQLRVGLSSASAFALDLGEGARARHTAAVVDFVEVQGCTVSAGCNGGFAPAIAVLPAAGAAPSEALVLWQARTADAAAACATSNDFAIAMARLQIEGEGSDARFAGATEVSSVLLHERGASGPPRVIAIGDDEDAGFLVAFPTGDHIEIAFIRRSEPDSSSKLVSIAARLDASAVSDLALGGDANRGLAIAYRVESEGKRVIKLRALELDRSKRRLAEVGVPVTVPSGPMILAGPTLTYADDGFVVPVSDEPTGGWTLAWVEPALADSNEGDRLLIGRVAEAGHRVLGEPTLLARGLITLPFTYLKQESAHSSAQCAFLESDALHVRRASCVKQ